jgi:hypothetical protein
LRFFRKCRFRYTLGLPLSGRDLGVTFSVGAAERPKSAETRERLDSKSGSGAGTEVGTREAVHRYQGGQTRRVPTRAHCGYGKKSRKQQEMVPDGTMVEETGVINKKSPPPDEAAEFVDECV